MGVNAATELS